MPIDRAFSCNIATFSSRCLSLLVNAASCMHCKKHAWFTGYTLWAAGSPVKQPAIATIPVFTPVLASSRVVAHACGRRRLQRCCWNTSPLHAQPHSEGLPGMLMYCATHPEQSQHTTQGTVCWLLLCTTLLSSMHFGWQQANQL